LAALRAACFIVDLSQSIRAVETCWGQDIIKVGLALNLRNLRINAFCLICIHWRLFANEIPVFLSNTVRH